MFEVIPIPAFQDNYIWLLHRNHRAVVVDPGDAGPVLQVLHERNLALDAILITHHHADHIDGVMPLLEAHTAQVYAPGKERFSFQHVPVGEGDIVRLPTLDAQFLVMETPGHTLGHVVYYGSNSLFCGDTLFSCGCGRLFEGSCEQLYHSLQRLASLPSDTQVYCTHEYTQTNIQFALGLEPDNAALRARSETVARLRVQGLPSLPTTIAQERATNPFLRCNSTAIQLVAQCEDEVTTFCRIRSLRNNFISSS